MTYIKILLFGVFCYIYYDSSALKLRISWGDRIGITFEQEDNKYFVT